MKLDVAYCAQSHLNLEGKHSETMTISAATWGTSEFKYINFVHNLACRYVFRVFEYTSDAAVRGDMGWETPYPISGCVTKM